MTRVVCASTAHMGHAPLACARWLVRALLSLLAAFVLNDCEWVGEKDGWRWLTCELLRCLTSIVIAAQWGEVGSEGSEGSDGNDDSENNHANDAYT